MRFPSVLPLVVLAILVIGGLLWASNNAVGPDASVEVEDEPTVSEGGNIRVWLPRPGQEVSVEQVFIAGEARVFESAYSWRVKDADGNVLAEGFGTASAPDIGLFGAFAVTATYNAAPGTYGSVEVFNYSARDGAEENMVQIPVYFSKK